MAQDLKAYNVVATVDVNPEVVDSLGCTEWTAYDADEVDAVLAEKDAEIRRLKHALWLTRAESYKMREFIAREKANLRDYLEWSRNLRQRLYHQWVDQLLRIANLANKLHNKCRSKAEELYNAGN